MTLRFLRALLGDSRAQYLMNKWLMVFWLLNLVIVPLVFFLAPAFWQKASILAMISVYACIGQHYTGMAAALAGVKTDEIREEDTAP